LVRKKSVYIETFGCQMNVADSERAATRLRSAGYELAGSSEGADVVLYNTCSVREKAERKVFHRIADVRRGAGREPLIGVLGCVAQLEGEAVFERAPSVRMVVGTGAADRIPELLERLEEGEGRVSDLGPRMGSEAWDVSPAERHSKYVAFVPIIEGCNKFCTYCIVPYSRGRERSRPAAEVVGEVKRLFELGYREVQLIGQNVNSYRPKTDAGLEKFRGATPFSKLLRAVASTGVPRIKFTTSFPRDFHRDIVSAIEENENLCEWVHLPVQSGSDAVLRAMRRGHKVVDYLKHVEAIKGARRRIALTSDVIVGFPGGILKRRFVWSSAAASTAYTSSSIRRGRGRPRPSFWTRSTPRRRRDASWPSRGRRRPSRKGSTGLTWGGLCLCSSRGRARGRPRT
jgi:tRNA-2-methylthio-N6-dimethylallyladenosine synthase